MFNTVIWATDGSEAAKKALPFAKKLAAGPGAKLVVLHVREILVGRAGGYPVRADDDDLTLELQGLVTGLRDEGFDATLTLITSHDENAAHAIADATREVDGEVIVLGIRGYGVVAGLLLGSVAQRLLHVSSCPVLAVPSHADLPVQAEGRKLADVAS